MPPQTQRYLDLARQGRNQWWRYALGILVIFFGMFAYFNFYILVYPLLLATLGHSSLTEIVAVNLYPIALLPGLAAAMRFNHRRPLLGLITPASHIDWRRVAYGAAAWSILIVAVTVIEHLLFPSRYYLSFNASRYFPFLALVLLLTPIQAAVEELVFRGYLMQGLGLLTRRPTWIVIMSSLAFVALHINNPEVEQHGPAIMAANYFLFGVLCATIALRDGRLELAIGLHAANNVFLDLVANYESSGLSSEAIFTKPAFDPVYSLVTLLICAFVYHWWIFGRAELADGVPPT